MTKRIQNTHLFQDPKWFQDRSQKWHQMQLNFLRILIFFSEFFDLIWPSYKQKKFLFLNQVPGALPKDTHLELGQMLFDLWHVGYRFTRLDELNSMVNSNLPSELIRKN